MSKITKEQKRELKGLIHEILVLRDKRCLKCGTTENLQASHIYSVGAYKKLEYDVDNIIFLCWRDHWWWHKNPLLSGEWLRSVLPKGRLEWLKLRSQTTGDGMREYKLLKLYLTKELKEYEDSASVAS